jgi:hypothetical protein
MPFKSKARSYPLIICILFASGIYSYPRFRDWLHMHPGSQPCSLEQVAYFICWHFSCENGQHSLSEDS